MSEQEILIKVWTCIGLFILTTLLVRALCEVIQFICDVISEVIENMPTPEQRKRHKEERFRQRESGRQLKRMLKYCEEERRRNGFYK